MKIDFKQLKNKTFNNYKENKTTVLVFLLVWILAIATTLYLYNPTLGKRAIGNESYDRSVVEINNNTNIKATIPVENDAESVSILFATYARNNVGNINIKIEGDRSHKVYIDNTYDVNAIQDNAYRTIKLNEKLNDKVDKNLIISINSTSNADQGVGVYYSNVKAFEKSSFTINGNNIENADLSMKYLIHDGSLHGFYVGVVIWTILSLSLIAFVVLLIKPKPEVLFALTAFLFGIIMMVIINPSAPPDELSHYEVVMQFANKLLLTEDYHYIDEAYVNYSHLYGHYNISAGYIRFIRDIFQPMKLKNELVVLSRELNEIYYAQYIPNVIGLTIGRLLNLNMFTTFYLGRLTGLLFYVACIYIAIKKAPSYKFLIGMIACMPMLIQIAISITTDTFILGLVFIVFGYFCKWYFEDNLIDIKDMIFLILVCNILAPAKIIYGLFGFMFYLLPSYKYGSKAKKYIFVSLMCASTYYYVYRRVRDPIKLFINMLCYKQEAKINLLDASGINQIIPNLKNKIISVLGGGMHKQQDDFQYSFWYMFAYPLETLDIFYRTIRYRIKFWFYGAIGRSLAGDTLILPLRIVHLMTAIVIASGFVKQDKIFSIPFKILLALICIAIGLAVIVVMFVSWTTSGQEIVDDFGGIIVEGIQGRYYSPILIHFFSLLPNRKLSLPKKSETYIFLTYLILFFEIVVYVLSYTFVN